MVVLGAGEAGACPHVPVGYSVEVRETTKQALIFHDGKNAHLVLSTGFEAQGPLPKSMAWIIPLPSLPVDYKVEDAGLFRTLYDSFEKHAGRGAKKPWIVFKSASGRGPGIAVHEAQQVGAYLVQPIEILSEGAGGELNAWLKKGGYNPVPAEAQRFYLRKGAAFLAVKIEAMQGKAIELHPLHITFPAEKAFLPLKFSAGSGVFDVLLYTLSAQDPGPGHLDHLGFEGEVWDLGKQPPSSSLVNAMARLGGLGRYLGRYQAKEFNARGKNVKDLKEDPTLGISKLKRLGVSSEF